MKMILDQTIVKVITNYTIKEAYPKTAYFYSFSLNIEILRDVSSLDVTQGVPKLQFLPHTMKDIRKHSKIIEIIL